MYHFNNHVGECLYLCTDHLGSVIGIIDEQGEMCYEAKYDAWGNQEVVKNDIGFIRGYTGHEEMPEFGLINMNARLYDPMLGRFISPDNFVQMPENSQNFNRYAYCLNNSLKYNDPSGNCIGAVIASVAFTMLSSACQTSMNHGDFGMFVKNFSLSMLSSVAGSYCSSAIGTAFGHTVGSFWNEALRAGAHGLFNGCVNAIDNGNFLSGFAAGVASSAAGSYAQFHHCGKTGVLAACTMGGGLASAIVEGGNGNAFLSGAQIGMSVGQFNHCGGDNNKRGFWRKLRDSISGIWNSAKKNPIAVEIEHLKEINLKEVIVNASRNVENPYLFVIKARVAEAMLLSFVTGIGPSDWTFNNDPLIASSLRNSWQVNAARKQYYKNEPIIKNGKFGLEGALRAGTDPIEQFVGGFDISVKPIENGTLLQFRIENTTSFNSLMYHQDWAKSWERSTFPIMGNMRQTYIFTEPIRR